MTEPREPTNVLIVTHQWRAVVMCLSVYLQKSASVPAFSIIDADCSLRSWRDFRARVLLIWLRSRESEWLSRERIGEESS